MDAVYHFAITKLLSHSFICICDKIIIHDYIPFKLTSWGYFMKRFLVIVYLKTISHAQQSIYPNKNTIMICTQVWHFPVFEK